LHSVVTIFSHFLQDPLASSAAKDLEVLKCASDVFATLLGRSPTGRETHQLNVVKDFVQELSRLAECALQKALRERKGVDRDIPSMMEIPVGISASHPVAIVANQTAVIRPNEAGKAVQL
jgi:hypothetical protein